MKKFIGGIITGVALSCTVAFAVNYTAEPNTFPIKYKGNDVQMEGYNINGSTYFKLRDIGDRVGFNVDFQNDIILIDTELEPQETDNAVKIYSFKDLYNAVNFPVAEVTRVQLQNDISIPKRWWDGCVEGLTPDEEADMWSMNPINIRNSTIELDLNGFTLHDTTGSEGGIGIWEDATLTILDTTGAGKIKGGISTIDNYGHLYMYDGTITGYIGVSNYGYFKLFDGIIAGGIEGISSADESETIISKGVIMASGHTFGDGEHQPGTAIRGNYRTSDDGELLSSSADYITQ